MENIRNPWWLGVSVACLLAGLLFVSTRGLFESTEGRYAEAAREMIETSSFAEPLLDYSPHLTKPPLLYWLTGLSLTIFGENPLAARAPGIISLLLTALLLSGVASRIWDRETGVLAGLLYLSSPLSLLAANIVSTDSLLTLWVTSLFSFYLLAVVDTSHVARYRFVFWIVAALGVLTKGLAMALPLTCIGLLHLYLRRPVRVLALLPIVIFILLGGGWYFFEAAHRPDFLSTLFHEQFASRFETDELHRNSRWYAPFIIYLPALVLGSGLWLALAWRASRKTSFQDVREQLRTETVVTAWLAAWAIVPLPVLFLAKSRLLLYIVPYFPPIALVLARLISSAYPRYSWSSSASRIVLLTAILLVPAKYFAATVSPKHDMGGLYELVQKFEQLPNVEFVVDSRAKLYGLEFYLRRSLERVRYFDSSGPAEETLLDELGESEKPNENERTESHVFIIRRSDWDNVKSLFVGRELQFQVSQNENWTVVSATPPH